MQITVWAESITCFNIDRNVNCLAYISNSRCKSFTFCIVQYVLYIIFGIVVAFNLLMFKFYIIKSSLLLNNSTY